MGHISAARWFFTTLTVNGNNTTVVFRCSTHSTNLHPSETFELPSPAVTTLRVQCMTTLTTISWYCHCYGQRPWIECHVDRLIKCFLNRSMPPEYVRKRPCFPIQIELCTLENATNYFSVTHWFATRFKFGPCRRNNEVFDFVETVFDDWPKKRAISTR